MQEPQPLSEPEMPLDLPTKGVTFPGIIEELGFDHLRSAERLNSTNTEHDNKNITMEVEGIVYEFDMNMTLPKRNAKEEPSGNETQQYNRAMTETVFIQRGIKVTSADNHLSRDITGRTVEGGGGVALYVYPGLRKEADSLRHLIYKTLGGSKSILTSDFFYPPETAVLDIRDINLVFDQALELPEFAKLKAVAEVHRERVLAKAKAQRRGKIAL